MTGLLKQANEIASKNLFSKMDYLKIQLLLLKDSIVNCDQYGSLIGWQQEGHMPVGDLQLTKMRVKVNSKSSRF